MSSDNDIVLSVRNVSKCFEMYEKPVHRLYQTLCAGKKRFYKEFWALRDINFEVRKGECVGIIGRNGAGKSTLLQIITGTLAPTTGEVKLKGRVAALLELGSGFNPEFTGKENVYLNGAILGLSKAEIDAKYDEIVAFADIGDFIDQPVKTYSSGMMVRLAFAVQVMVEPDVLIVDEALAVGDAAFQRKCYMRMEMLKRSGVTVLLVTHDTETVKQFCARAIFLRDHSMAFDGPAEDGVALYMQYLFPVESAASGQTGRLTTESAVSHRCRETPDGTYVYEHSNPETDPHVWGVGGGIIERIRIYGLETPNILRTPGSFRVEVDASWNQEFVRRKIASERLPANMMIGIRLADVKNIAVFGSNNVLEGVPVDPFEHDAVTVSYDFKLPALCPGDMFLTVALAIGKMNASTDLVWDDLAIQLKCVSPSLSGSVIYCPTAIEVRGR